MSIFASLFCLSLAATPTSTAPAAKVAPLPLRRVRLYEIGVAYYERRGRMKKGRHSALPLPTSHIDDALKTLVVLSPNEDVQIRGLSYATTVPQDAARVLAGLAPADERELDYGALLRSLQGQQVRVELAERELTGRIVEVQGPLARPALAPTATAKAPDTRPYSEEYELVLLEHDGTLTRARTDEFTSLRPLEDGRQQRLEMAAQSLSDTRAQQSSGFEIEVLRPGELALGYVGESALWGINYRLVMQGEQAQLQAWALVHNDGDEAWDEVAVELVNGQPRSFIFAQASPHYTERAIEADDRPIMLSPQLSRSTPDEMTYGEVYGVGGLGLVGTGRGGGGYGEGTIGLGSTGLIGHGGGGGVGGQVELGDLAEFAQADGSESGAQFIYALPGKIDLEAHHSALLPVFTSPIAGSAITYWYQGEAAAAVRLENDTRQTLPAGTISMFSGGGFAGESRLDRMKPGEAHFVFFGKELDVEVDNERIEQNDELAKVVLHEEGFALSFVRETTTELHVSNRAGHAKKVVVALDLPRNAKLAGSDDVDWDADRGRVLVGVPTPAGGKTTERITTQVSHGSHMQWDDIEAKRLRELAESPRLADKSARGLIAFADILDSRAQLYSEDEELRKERNRVLERLERARKNLESLGSAGVRGDSPRKAAKKIAALETEIEKLDIRIESVKQRDRNLDKEVKVTMKLFEAK
jgi:hypothetical protein